MEGEEEGVLEFKVEEEQQQDGQDHKDEDNVWEAYRGFVKGVRAYGDQNDLCLAGKSVFDVILRTNRHMIGLRLSRASFSILGYQMDGQWLEFDNLKSICRIQRRRMEPEHLIPASSMLDLRDDYDYLVEQLEEGNENLYTIPLGQHDLVTAVDTLATTQSRTARARSLLVVSLIVREGSRFPAIADHLAKEFCRSLPLPSELISSVYKYRYHSIRHLPSSSSMVDSDLMEGEPLTFNVHQVGRDKEDGVWETYANFVKSMRAIGFWKRIDPSLKAKGLFDIVLRTNRHGIRLRLCRSSFLILGYQMEGTSPSSPNEQWMEFGCDIKRTRWILRFMDMLHHRIPGSSFLDMEEDYDELLERMEGKETLYTIRLGRQDLVDAVDTLATSKIRKERAKSLLVISLMVCDGSKFPAISRHLAKEFCKSSPLPSDMVSLVRYYMFSSLVFLPRAHHPDVSGDEADSGKCKPKALQDEDVLGKSKPKSANSQIQSSSLPTRSFHRYPIVPCLQRELVEVFFLRIDDINHSDSGYFYGTVVVEEGSSTREPIFSRAKEEAEFVESGDTILLTGPRKSISAISHFEFCFTLMGEDMDPYGGQVCWDAMNPSRRGEYNKLLLHDFDGEHCTVTVCYIAYDNAAEALFEVEIIEGNVGDVGQCWGQIAAVCEKFGRESVLFRRKSNECVEVQQDERIKLSRCVVAVPYDSLLIVRAELYAYDDEVIAKGTAKFSVQRGGSSEEVVCGIGYKVRVKITWR